MTGAFDFGLWHVRAALRRRRLARALGRSAGRIGAPVVTPDLRVRDFGATPHRAVFGRTPLRLTVDPTLERRGGGKRWVLRERAPSFLYLFSRLGPEVGGMIADLSDGEESGPGIVSGCSRDPGALLVPDCIFVASGGYRHARGVMRDPPAWESRADLVLWRGSTTGTGPITTPEMRPQDLTGRVGMCLLLRGLPGVDVRLAGVVQSADPAGDRARLEAAGLCATSLSPWLWQTVRYAIDIDGNTNAWSNLFTRLLAGCCVLKVASAHGYRQWYYDRLLPWVHYVPVSADMADFAERIAWCRSHPGDCAGIARAGRALALSLTFQDEIARTVAHLPGRLAALAGNP